MERLAVSAFLLFLLKHKVTYATMCLNQRFTEKDLYLQGFTIESSKVETIFACYTKCENNILCSSINLMLTDKTCELKYSTKSRHPEKIINRTNTMYMEIRDGNDTQRSKPVIPFSSCKKIKENDNQAKSGVYWLKFNEPSSEPFKVFCEMTIDGGGWTLVYSYTFTAFDAFLSNANAITPVPSWPLDKSSGTWVPESITTPVSESSHSAMDFALWKKIGKEILLKPNISNWVACVEGTGSLVNWKTGSMTCRVVKNIAFHCTTRAPNSLRFHPCGPCFFHSNKYWDSFIFLDGMTSKYYPGHDPCVTGSKYNYLTNVSSPGGAIYVR